MKHIPLKILAKELSLFVPSDVFILGYRIDSRLVQPGDLFFALAGARTDGHHHLAEVKQKGAIAAVVNQNYQGPDYGLFLLKVEDVAASLTFLAKYSLELTNPFIIAITGSLGKTTTKEFIATLLQGKTSVAKTFGSYNTQLTLPLTILNRGEEKVLVLEMGMSGPGQIKKLVQIAPPDLAVLTKISLSHAEFFPGGLEEIKREKMDIFSHPKTKIGIVPSSLQIPFSHVKPIFFSQQDRQAEFFISFSKEKASIYEKGIFGFSFTSPFELPHLLYNLLCAIAVAKTMQMSWEEIECQIPLLQTPKMRFEQFEHKGILVINDAYNANPESMREALSHLPLPKKGGKRIAVLGSMKELGIFSEKSHEEVGVFARSFVDHLLCLGSEAAKIAQTFAEAQKPVEHFMDKMKLASRLKELMKPGDVVLLKGSRSMQLEDLLPGGSHVAFTC